MLYLYNRSVHPGYFLFKDRIEIIIHMFSLNISARIGKQGFMSTVMSQLKKERHETYRCYKGKCWETSALSARGNRLLARSPMFCNIVLDSTYHNQYFIYRQCHVTQFSSGHISEDRKAMSYHSSTFCLFLVLKEKVARIVQSFIVRVD